MDIKKEVKIYSTGYEHHFFFDGKKHGGFASKKAAKEAAKEMNRAKYARDKKYGGKKEGKIATGKAEVVRKGLWFEELKKEKDACYHKVRSRYKKWPSAYASGALVRCRKVGAKNWGNKSKKK